MTVLVAGTRPEDFANLHPGGKLGKKLARVEHLMHGGDATPVVHVDTPMHDAIYEMSHKGLGIACVVDGDAALVGIITDGDLRRTMGTTPRVLSLSAVDVMTRHPIAVSRTMLAAEALNVLEQRKITWLVVIDDARRAEGVVHLHHFRRTGLV
jgi:arabinose-5-phosphate isomerase